MNLQEMKDMQEIYNEIKEKLTDPFPKGTVQLNESKDIASIPVQAYIKRLEEVAGVFWSWKLVGDPVIYEKEYQVQVKGVLKILGAEREGIGFANFQVYEDTLKIKNLKNAVLSAESDALRKACDKFQMGWKDLAPYRKWGDNPAVNLSTHQERPQNVQDVSPEKCAKCSKYLTQEELQFLNDHQIKIKYCKNDIPPHLLKKRS
ncbi:hypothetical protein [Metabacillus fastidiosus]|uniref:hypothetical protein n=1 Tax=Metabacillus fastidiosus TaxID=1458 RepID=UPI003D2A9904